MGLVRPMGKVVRILLPAACSLALLAQGSEWIQGHYLKRECMVPMRDGTELFTAIYSPRFSGPCPILVKRTPYGVAPYGRESFPEDLGPSPGFAEKKFIFVYQDVRGRGMSRGEFVDMTPQRPKHSGPFDTDESTDAYDTVQWLLDHVRGHNGKVGLWGASYPGFYAAAGLIDAHPAVVACSPQAPTMDWFTGDDFHRNGALWLPHFFDFIAWFGLPRPKPTTNARPAGFNYGTDDGYAFYLALGPLANVNARYFHGKISFWNEVMAHGTRDAFWKARDLRPHLRDIRPAVLLVGGWFDAENLFGSLEAFKALASQSPATPLTLVMGPWYHGAWSYDSGRRLGKVDFGSSTSDFYRKTVELPFFMHHLKGAPDPELPRALLFQTGANRWERFDAWPPRSVRTARMYFQPGWGLSQLPPRESGGADEFVSDPADPVPFWEGTDLEMPVEYMTADQRFASARRDVLTYRSEPLKVDLTVAGPIRVHLDVSTTGTDADWVVKVIDEHPDAGDPLPGYQQLVRGEVMRGKFRNSLEFPEPFTPGQPTVVAWSLNDVFHTFRKGHRLTVQVQSSWFPMMDRNPQVFTDIYRARAEDFKPAKHRLNHSAGLPSSLELPVLEPGE
ncbi:MAG TPA: CocE/NonD family hydrolase [Holophaga sp.]|nr:CocE/NonD family hydrolase [Holophaga sp.]